ncbi:MAG: ImmA/IrrE family metallo-endopeptidase [Candidatus Eisenbacteria bacterium]|nr:ImmA/IrrE family metallo-endopeptidase [Candidatus Eisenbacteria bacterium]
MQPSTRERLQELGNRIQKMRIDNGLSQRELARLCGFPAHQTISMIEQGRRGVRAWEAQALAIALNQDLESLLSPGPEVAPVPALQWSAMTGRRARVGSRQKRIEAFFARKLLDYARVEDLCGLEASQWLDDFEWDWKNPSVWQAEKLAGAVAGSLDLGSRPAFALLRLLEEEFLIKVWYEDIAAVGVSACTRGPAGDGILLNSLEAPWRRNYHGARELFRLIAWPPSAPSEVPASLVSRLANTFASTLLLPHSEFDRLLARRKAATGLTFEDLFQLARDFGVSSETVLRRLEGLRRLRPEDVERLLRDSHLRAIDRQVVGASWLRAPKPPERFARLCFFAYRRGGLPRAALARLLDCELADVRGVLLSYGFDDQEDYGTAVSAG